MTTSPSDPSSLASDEREGAGPARGDGGRIVVIDVLRGLAILWVMTFHMWADITFNITFASTLYDRLGDRMREGDALASLTATGEVILGSGYQGVAVFMMLSGLSLTLNAKGRAGPRFLPLFIARCRRIVPVYWAGILISFGMVAFIATLQYWVDGGSWASQWNNVTFGVIGIVPTNLVDPLWGLSVVGPIVRDKSGTWTVASLWFFPLLLQYYLLFPLLLRVLERVGPWVFAAIAIAFTALALEIYADYVAEFVPAAYFFKAPSLLAPLRGAEFMLGMSLGWLLAHRRQQVNSWVKSPFDTAGLVALAVLLQWTAVSIFAGSVVFNSLSLPLSQAALAVFAVPLLFKTPGRLEVSVPARLLVGLGIVSFPALIVNDQVRYFTSFLLNHDVDDIGVIWWPYLVAVYIPAATVLFAWPLARLFGLMPDQRKPASSPPREPASDEVPPGFAPAPAPGGS